MLDIGASPRSPQRDEKFLRYELRGLLRRGSGWKFARIETVDLHIGHGPPIQAAVLARQSGECFLERASEPLLLAGAIALERDVPDVEAQSVSRRRARCLGRAPLRRRGCGGRSNRTVMANPLFRPPSAAFPSWNFAVRRRKYVRRPDLGFSSAARNAACIAMLRITPPDTLSCAKRSNSSAPRGVCGGKIRQISSREATSGKGNGTMKRMRRMNAAWIACCIVVVRMATPGYVSMRCSR